MVGYKEILILIIFSFVIGQSADNVFAVEALTGDAKLTVVPPNEHTLIINKYPDFNFGTLAIGSTRTAEAQGSTPYLISDLRGGDAGYKIQVSISDFVSINDDKNVLPVDSVTLSVGNSSNGHLIGTAVGVDVFKTQGTVITGNATANGQQLSGPVLATIHFSNTSKTILPGEYQATITHNVVSGI